MHPSGFGSDLSAGQPSRPLKPGPIPAAMMPPKVAPTSASTAAEQAKLYLKREKALRDLRRRPLPAPVAVGIVGLGSVSATLLARVARGSTRRYPPGIVVFPEAGNLPLREAWAAGQIVVVEAAEAEAFARRLKKIRETRGPGKIFAIVGGSTLKRLPEIPGVTTVVLPRSTTLGSAKLQDLIKAEILKRAAPVRAVVQKDQRRIVLDKSFGAPASGLGSKGISLPGFGRLSQSKGLLPHVAIVRPILETSALATPPTSSAIPDRRVDAQVARLDPKGQEAWLKNGQHLARGDHFRLAVHIGSPGTYSLMVDGGPPSIDLQLPSLAEGAFHALQVLLFPGDFVLESAARCELKLYKMGESETVSWKLWLPPAGSEPAGSVKSAPEAALRFNVCYHNQILQSFVLKARLEDGPGDPSGTTKGELPLFVRYDYQQVPSFERLDRLPHRLLAAGLSTDATGSTHSLTLGKDGAAVEIRWPEAQMATFTNAVRKALFAALSPDGKRSPYRFEPVTLKLAAAPPEFDAAVRSLAAAGRAVWDALFARNPSARAPLKEVLTSQGQVLQIVRHDIDYAFPWTLLYDYTLPRGPSAATAPVCRGSDGHGGPCDCGPAPTGYCLRGFWGIRHIIEQRCNTPLPETGDPGIISANPTQPVLCVVPGVPDPFVNAYIQALPAALSKRILDPVPDDLLAALREPASRPSLVVYVGHMNEVDVFGIPTPQLVNRQGDSILSRTDVVEEMSRATTWGVPRSLILLMACGSGVSRVDLGTGLAASLLLLGAEGVLGAECTVFTGIASRVARDLTEKLLCGEPMGEAVRSTLANLAAEGCPAGLAFTYLGPAELRLPT